MSEAPVAFSVVNGNPTDEELAALIVVLAFGSRAGNTEPSSRPPGWSAYWRTIRAPVAPGPDAWRMSGRPQ